MPQSLSKVYVHITFSTKHREDAIDESIEGRLFDYLGGICKGLECNPIQVGGFKNHVHVLCTLSRKVTQSKLLEELKKQSSLWIKGVDKKYSNFYWQNGYGIFSVNPTEVDIVERYIKNQKRHHQKRSFKEELQAFLKKYEVDYDERYIWD
ncbi:Transposase [Salinivirga cyanobacteriivorans]|uniref:Transposase n=1 Tax=Salinivirga cyanobacteriivorans TaxID=1307839 RepID=A0A0S2HXU4_9BACT|nr:IS200/IS605 family transposase [Salinivirga cyanobacteriivorans]ALO14804.1 Transposase [Salinivirga cyanobacteriivorans]ALO14805.1 Transposase [Salinivirga cyanobacteriivorans]